MTNPTTLLAALYASLPTLPNGQHPEAILAALDKLGWTLVRKGEPSEGQENALALRHEIEKGFRPPANTFADSLDLATQNVLDWLADPPRSKRPDDAGSIRRAA